MLNQKIFIRCRSAFVLSLGMFLSACAVPAAAQTAARQWNEALLDAIRLDFPAPTVHSRNLYHTSAAMFDAWAAFDPIAKGRFYNEKHSIQGIDVASARSEAISYAAYRILSHRYQYATDPVASQARFDTLFESQGYDRRNTTVEGNSPAAIGNRIAATVINSTLNDGSNEANGFVDNTGYSPTNVPMVVEYPGVVTPDVQGTIAPNHWQPLFLDVAVTQNGLEGDSLQTYIGPHWGHVETFAMGRGMDQEYSWSHLDPGPPPQLGGEGDAAYRDDTMTLLHYSRSLDPNRLDGATQINISPRVNGNRPLGTHTNMGYAINPVTQQPYADNMVKAADYGRVLAEYWADGPNSETPPGHWNVIANQLSDNQLLEKRLGGVGPVLDDMEWDVKTYLALNGATHDAAVAAWGAKRAYDYVRPITKIRLQGSLGQSSDPSLPSFHADGLPLISGEVELITAESIAEGGRHRNALANANRAAEPGDPFMTEAEMVGRVAVLGWNHEPADPETEVSGIDWILAENWVPYQDDNFVTPAFAAYVSGHSAFSRAAAEVLTALTGSEYFPGGLGQQTFTSEFLEFEHGPSEAITLQWATYFDAADEAGISRLWGGIHVPVDDFAGRVMGSQIGIGAYEYVQQFYESDELTWQNAVWNTDVNHDGFVVSIDALHIINELNSPQVSMEGGLLPAVDGVPSFFFDANKDGYFTPQDALIVINFVNANGNIPAAPLSAIAVPEPGGVAALAFLAAAMISRIRRSNR